MRRVLHILTKPDDKLAAEIITKQQESANAETEIIDLTAGEPDYQQLVTKIFTADSVEVW